MEFGNDELRDLAVFCARRFPDPAARARLLSAAGLGPLVEAEDDEPTAPRRPGGSVAEAAWAELLRHAQAQGRLEALLRAMVAAAPGDRNLAEAAALIAGPPPPGPGPSRGPLWVGFGLGALLVVGLVAVFSGRDEAPTTPAGAPPVAAAPPPVAAAPTAPAPPASPPVPPSPAPAPTTAPAATPAAAAAPTGGTSPPGCEGAAGTVAGWWYAGTSAPGVQGATITMDRSARVRADYPRRDNGWLATARERCVLPAGARVTLSHAPVHVEGDRWWVPFASGDLQRP